MQKIILSLFLFQILINSCSNVEKTKPDSLKQDSIPITKMKTLNYEDLNPQQKLSMDSLLDNWNRTVFYPACDKDGFKQNCEVCGDIYWDVELIISKDWQVEKTEHPVSLVDCSGKNAAEKSQLEKTAVYGIEKLVFSVNLRGIRLHCRFGKVTRC